MSDITSYERGRLGDLTYRAPNPVKRPVTPSCRLIDTRRPVMVSPGRALVLLIFDKRVSAGCEMIAAAKPAIRPEPKLRELASAGERLCFGLP